jgi:hypothetical protein
MTTGRINQVTILKPPSAAEAAVSSKVVRFAKNMIPPRKADTTGPFAQRIALS